MLDSPRWALRFLPLFVIACLPETAERIESPDGRERYELVCPGGTAQCMHDAKAACPDGYAIDYSHGEAYQEHESTSTGYVSRDGWATGRSEGTTRTRREVTIRITCRHRR
jgi:hypothetical protein